ncbi:MAG: hypothetical protein KDA75_22275, partial [Planctomycetaceae bacterium]|nr:hypothetical protein [Planctomycetaceae bacterium]
FRQENGPDDKANAIVSLFTQGDDCRLLCLEAAVADDPSCAAAWQELVLRTEEPQRRLEAIAAWEVSDPDNAAPRYLRAWACESQGDRNACLEALRAGNALAACRFPAPLQPEQFRLAYPNDASLPEAAGQAVTTAALANLLYLQDLAEDDVRVAQRLHALAAALANDAASATALQVSPENMGVQLRALGLHLIGGAESNASQVRHGLAILQLGAAIDQAVDQQSALSQYDFHLQRSTRELSAGLLQWQARSNRLLEDRVSILRGRVDLRAEERAAMQALVTQPRLQAGLMAESATTR